MNLIKKLFGAKSSSIFAKLNPAHPHGGLDHFSDSEAYPIGIEITGVTMEEAKRDLCGKVLDWSLVTDAQMKAMQKKKLSVSLEELKGMFR